MASILETPFLFSPYSLPARMPSELVMMSVFAHRAWGIGFKPVGNAWDACFRKKIPVVVAILDPKPGQPDPGFHDDQRNKNGANYQDCFLQNIF